MLELLFLNLEFHRTYSSEAFRDRNERCRLLVQKVKVQRHDGIKYVGNNSLTVEANSTGTCVKLLVTGSVVSE